MICTRFRREGKAKALPWSLCQSRLNAMTETYSIALAKHSHPGEVWGLSPSPRDKDLLFSSHNQGTPTQRRKPNPPILECDEII